MLAELALKLNLFHHPPPLLLAPVRSRLLPRGDPLINEGTKWFDEAIKITKNPNVDIETLEELVRKGKEAVMNLQAAIEDLEKVVPPSSPPRYDLTPSDPRLNPPSISGSHVPWPPE
ncbi:hypothetical protein CF319_g8372 [Tilletia indica]|nr:hypothetical protein CF319_g8372 [Tilletia indica]